MGEQIVLASLLDRVQKTTFPNETPKPILTSLDLHPLGAENVAL